MSDTNDIDVLIIGGGLAGLANAIHLSRAGFKVLLIEKNEFPKHKVCGEYISNEVLPYLEYLGLNPFELGATQINRFNLSTPKGKIIETTLPLGGFGISRYTLDYALYQLALENQCVVVQATVNNIDFENGLFKVCTKNGSTYFAKLVIGAFGKRSNLDIHLNREFIQKKAPFLAVKSHYIGSFPEDLVALHNFKGGYCGISKVEKGYVNICYLADFRTFKKHKNISIFEQEVLFKNPHLQNIFQQMEPAFSNPLTISQISFSNKKTVENHIFMSGDTAGMIHPLCGNGMGMALHSAQILSQLIIQYFNKKMTNRIKLEKAYTREWKSVFQKRLIASHLFNTFLARKRLFEWTMTGLAIVPQVLPILIKQTHGAPLPIQP